MLEIKVEIPDLAELVREQGANVIRDITTGLEAEFKARMDRQGTGKFYKRGKTAVHQASAPGEAPVIDSNNLVNSIMSTIEELRGEIVMNDYGFFLDQGIIGAGKYGKVNIAARPFIMPSLEEVLQKIREN